MSDSTSPSRVDAWLVGLILAAIGSTTYRAVLRYPESPTERLAGLGVVAVAMLVVGLVGYPCTYTLAEDHLLIRSGIVRQRIAYRDITAMETSSSPWSAPALSIRRIKVSFAGGFQLISPRDREAFLHALRERVEAARSRS